MRSMDAGLVCECDVVFIHADGTRSPGRIWVNRPRRSGAGSAECSVGIDGLHPALPPVAGADTLQALVLALRLIGALLHDFVGRGGKIRLPNCEAELELGAYFGP